MRPFIYIHIPLIVVLLSSCFTADAKSIPSSATSSRRRGAQRCSTAPSPDVWRPSPPTDDDQETYRLATVSWWRPSWWLRAAETVRRPGWRLEWLLKPTRFRHLKASVTGLDDEFWLRSPVPKWWRRAVDCWPLAVRAPVDCWPPPPSQHPHSPSLSPSVCAASTTRRRSSGTPCGSCRWASRREVDWRKPFVSCFVQRGHDHAGDVEGVKSTKCTKWMKVGKLKGEKQMKRHNEIIIGISICFLFLFSHKTGWCWQVAIHLCWTHSTIIFKKVPKILI